MWKFLYISLDKTTASCNRFIIILKIKKMKKNTFKLLSFIALVVIIVKILNWFLNFSDTTNNIINSLMFSLIGISYFILGFNLEKKLNRIILFVCGLYLIIFNFFPEKNYVAIIGILVIVTAILIRKFSKETKNAMES